MGCRALCGSVEEFAPQACRPGRVGALVGRGRASGMGKPLAVFPYHDLIVGGVGGLLLVQLEFSAPPSHEAAAPLTSCPSLQAISREPWD
jgi:hypothetical protein